MPTNAIIFRTTRLLVRQLSLSDLPAYRSVEGDPLVMRYITGRPRTPAESRARMLDFINNYATEPHTGVWAVIELSSSHYIGTASLSTLENCEELQIGYKLKPLAQGKGYATEIAKALVHHAFFKARLEKIVAVTHPHNKASQRVLLKAGMQLQQNFHYAYDQYLPFFALEKVQYLEHLRKRR